MTAVLSDLVAGLKRIYSDETFEYAQNAASPLVELFEEAKSLSPEGEGYFWPMMLRSPQNISTPPEAGNVPPVKARTEVQGKLNAGQFVGTFDVTWMVEAASTARGGWNKGEVKKSSFDTLRDLVKHRNRLYSGTWGTGALCQITEDGAGVQQNFLAKTQATGAGWAGAGFTTLLLRPNMMIDVYTLDSGGTATMTSRKITLIVPSTRRVTFDGATADLVSDSYVYIAGTYGQSTVPNGLLNLVDDGEFAVNVHGLSRTTYPELKAMVVRNGGTLRALTEDLFVNAGLLLRQQSGGSIDCLVMNTGQLAQWIKVIRPLRYQDITGSGPMKYSIGFPSESSFKFYFDGRPLKFVVSEDIAPRHIYGLDLSQMRRAVLKKLGWYDHGGGSMFIQGADSGGLKTTKQATMYSLENIGTFSPWAHIRWQDLSDPQLCGATYGGTDTL